MKYLTPLFMLLLLIGCCANSPLYDASAKSLAMMQALEGDISKAEKNDMAKLDYMLDKSSKGGSEKGALRQRAKDFWHGAKARARLIREFLELNMAYHGRK